MDDNLHNVNELMRELEALSITTSQGTFIKKEDVRRLAERRFAANEIEAKEAPAPKTVEEARSQAKEFLKKVSLPSTGPKDLGKSIPATEAHSPSRA